LMNHSKFDDAERLINLSLQVKPGSPESIQLLNKNKQLKSLSTNELN
jgi:hypothetical protein